MPAPAVRVVDRLVDLADVPATPASESLRRTADGAAWEAVLLAPQASLDAHTGASAGVHGIADTSQLVVTTDPRLANARTPTAHASTHATAGSDPVSPGSIGAVTTAPASAAANTIQPTAATVQPLVLKAAVSQSVNLQEWQTSAAGVAAKVLAAGDIFTTASLNAGLSSGLGGQLNVKSGGVSTVAVMIRAFASQTADIQEWQNSSGTVLAKVDADGTVVASNNGVNTNTIRAASGGNRLFLGGGTTGDVVVNPGNAANVALAVKAAVTQTANVAEFQDSTGAPLVKVDPSGTVSAAKFVLNTPVAARTLNNWTVGANALRTLDRNSFTLQNLFDFVATNVSDLQAAGLFT